MEVNPLSAIPAAGLAIATLLPESMRRRRTVGCLVVAGAYAAQSSMDGSGRVLIGVVPEAGEALSDGQRLINLAASSSYVGLLSVPVVGLARMLPIRRVFAAAALAGGYVALDAKLAEVAQAAKQKAQAARERALKARDRVQHARGAVGRSEGVWHQAATTH